MPLYDRDINPPILPEWKAQPKRWGHPFHPMCSYMAMFPPRLPHYFIQRFTNPGDTVLDPFSGRGTTPTQACAEGRVGIAGDLNPLAYVLSRAKVDPPALEDAQRRLSELQAGYTPSAHWSDPHGEAIEGVYHPGTLAQLRYLKATLSDDRTDNFLTATIVGIMHGKYRRSGTDSLYLSIDMPNTFSMSPGYISRYVKQHGIKPLPLDVFDNVSQRLERLFRYGPPLTTGAAYRTDVRRMHENLAPESVQLVVSSPPYLKVVKYGLYNWIRLWFLGVASDDVDQSLDDGHALPAYLEFMGAALAQMERLMAPGAVCAMIIGDVAQHGQKPQNLAWDVWDGVGKDSGLQLVDIVADPIADNVKVTKIWNATRGRATSVDRILVMCKGDRPAVNRLPISWSQPWD